MTQTTTACCGPSMIINHVEGEVAPVTKTVTYGTVANIPGEPSKCWITSNLGADRQATDVSDDSEAAAGWYWQFNRKQGYKHDGLTVTPSWTITSISEDADWSISNDPCRLELGSGWRIPTVTEWNNVKTTGGWTDWNGPWNSDLKLHAAGHLIDGSLIDRGNEGYCWSSEQYDTYFYEYYARCLWFSGSSNTYVYYREKSAGLSLRCLRD